MNPLTCEMCGSTNLVKEDGVFVCKSCGTKYSVEEAKKIMAGDTVTVAGTVQIDTSADLENLYLVAREASLYKEHERASECYEKILLKDPKNWEPNFFARYHQAYKKGLRDVVETCDAIFLTTTTVLGLIKEIADEEKQEKAIGTVVERIYDLSKAIYKENLPADWNNYSSPLKWMNLGVLRLTDIPTTLFLLSFDISLVANNKYEKYVADCLKHAFDLCMAVDDRSMELELEDHPNYLEIIRKYYPDYVVITPTEKEAIEKRKKEEEEHQKVQQKETAEKKGGIIKFVLESLGWSAVIYIVYLIFFK